MISRDLLAPVLSPYSGLQMPLASLGIALGEVRNGLEQLLPQVLSQSFDELKLASPARHRGLVDSANTLALVALGHKPLACLSDSSSSVRSQVSDQFGVLYVKVALPFERAHRERFHIYNPATISRLIDSHDDFTHLRGLTLEDTIREVMARPRHSGADTDYHRCLGLLYGYPEQAVRHFAFEQGRGDKTPPTLNTLETLLSERVSRDTYSYLFSESIPFDSRRNCLAEIVSEQKNSEGILSRFADECRQRSYGIARFIWRDLKDSLASMQKVDLMIHDLTKLQLPFYLSEGSMGNQKFIRPDKGGCCDK